MRIFFRILATFWIVMLVGITLATFGPGDSAPGPVEPLRRIPLGVLQSCAQQAASRPLELSQCYGGRLVAGGSPPTTDLADKPLSQEEQHLVRKAQGHTDVVMDEEAKRTVVAIRSDPHSVISPIFLAYVPLAKSEFTRNEISHVGRLILLSGLFSLLVSIYIVMPITRLSAVAERFGSGDLKVRAIAPLIRRKDEMGDLGRGFNEMAERIELLVTRYRYFLAHASHELGTPLTRLNIALALAKRKADASLTPELDRIGQESERLNSLVQELLFLARLESGNELGLKPVLFDVHAFIEEACESAHFEASQIGRSVTMVQGEPFQIVGYPELIQRALDNVLRNGVRFSPTNGVVEVRCVKKSQSGKGVIIIQDCGPGVQEGQEEAIFEPFTRLAQPENIAASEGAGLGLAIAKQAVLANKGTIRADSRLGGGLIITIELPLATTSH